MAFRENMYTPIRHAIFLRRDSLNVIYMHDPKSSLGYRAAEESKHSNPRGL